ncbi:MAG: hypothetical protein ACOYN2_04185 [Patescibacteria group bacterium]
MDFDSLSSDALLSILSKFLDEISAKLKQYSNPYNGDEFRLVKFSESFYDKEKMVDATANAPSLEQELINTEWYVLNGFNGSSEEENLIRAITKTI